MDSVTQAVLGATVAAACVPKEHRRKAIAMGAALGTLPDLDVFLDYGNAVANFTLHRGFTHSLFVLIPFAAGLWYVLRRYYSPVKEYPKHWFWAIFLVLVTHPLLDAHTAYGTQLFWPMDVTPTMWSTLFIIDPLYTIPLLIAVIVSLAVPNKQWVGRFIKSCLVISCLYLGWSWIAKIQVTQQVTTMLEQEGKSLSDVALFSTPTPFNTIMWRFVVHEESSYREGYYHFLNQKLIVNRFDNNQPLFDQAESIASLKQLEWFSDSFNRADIIDGQLVISDLRMGFEDNYVFRHAVAEKQGDDWQEITSVQLPRQFNADDFSDFWGLLTELD